MSSKVWEVHPAFCALLYASLVDGYNSKCKVLIPIYLPYILVPILLHKESRRSLPKTSASKFHKWLQNEPHIVVGLDKRINSLEPYISRSSMFLNAQGLLAVDNEFRISISNRSKFKKMAKDAEYISEYIEAAKNFGEICGKFNSESTMLTLLGVKL
tara:strand:- start:102 stop:572 length:471 start_codon:yes stop_codon:yes gene_type:complete